MISTNTSLVGNNHGFTLVELMITLAMSGIVVAAIYSAYIIQQKTYYTQSQVVEMQQNIRAGLEMMSREIRMAGYDPDGKAGASITTATASKLSFTADLDDNGDVVGTNENVTFCLKVVGTDTDADADGCDDNGSAETTGTAAVNRNAQGVAEGIQSIEFFYLDDGNTPLIQPISKLSEIKTVQITLLAISSQRDPKYTNTETYTTASGASWGPFNDNFRRRLLTTSVSIRNHGLN